MQRCPAGQKSLSQLPEYAEHSSGANGFRRNVRMLGANLRTTSGEPECEWLTGCEVCDADRGGHTKVQVTHESHTLQK